MLHPFPLGKMFLPNWKYYIFGRITERVRARAYTHTYTERVRETHTHHFRTQSQIIMFSIFHNLF